MAVDRYKQRSNLARITKTAFEQMLITPRLKYLELGIDLWINPFPCMGTFEQYSQSSVGVSEGMDFTNGIALGTV